MNNGMIALLHKGAGVKHHLAHNGGPTVCHACHAIFGRGMLGQTVGNASALARPSPSSSAPRPALSTSLRPVPQCAPPDITDSPAFVVLPRRIPEFELCPYALCCASLLRSIRNGREEYCHPYFFFSGEFS